MSDEVREMLDSTNFQFKDVDENGNEIEMTLSEAMESLNNTNWELAKENENLQQRIDKAVEYINKYEYQKYCPSPYEKDKYIMREEKEGQDLLDILRGDE